MSGQADAASGDVVSSGAASSHAASGVDTAARPAGRPVPTAAGPRVGIVGLGRAGSALGTALSGANWPVVAVHARSAAALERARLRFPTASIGTPASVVEASDVVILTVSDDAIEDVARSVAAAGVLRAGQVVAHASGRHGTDILHPVLAHGAFRAAVHPIMTLSGTDDDAGRLVGAGFGVTADPGAQSVANALVTAVGGRVVPVPERARTAYHAAIVLGANYLATLVTAMLELLAALGVDQPAGAVAPLLEQSLRGAVERGPAALTGPVRRGDAGTVRAHLDALAAHDQAVASVYAALAALTVDQLERAGLAGGEPASGIRDVLRAAGGQGLAAPGPGTPGPVTQDMDSGRQLGNQ
ncbi:MULTISPECIES: Rossmann-like and DUF2520 domain-containing protein [Protofrankia]|uniref:NADP oxidoreductase coenzyme F420-dependent n=1 Tax=Candidatus Protofrankia datiscae TaxID=2716812 RepID=F8AVG0_9ACTN|nr:MULTISPECIES: Rossmann-like and DUF2520 domain-containing protein [Protofrankia]AEH11264.1 Domain of unknown function DUF2520-containing protein [Candidatus Protofrankia datiscae]